MDYGHSQADKKLKALERKLQKEYKKASKQVEAKMKEYLAEFESQDVIMAERLKAGEITKKQYMKWRSESMMMTKKWEALSSDLANAYANSGKIAEAMIRDNAYDVYALNFNFGTFEVERTAGVDTAFALYDKNTVERLVKDNPKLLPPPGKKTSKAIARGELKRWNRRQIQSVMTQSILQGESIPKIAKRLAETVGERNMHSAIRNARTMTTSAENAGRLDSYRRAKDMGIEVMKTWVATLDDRTRHSHEMVDGETVDVEDTFSNGLMFPADPDGDPEEVYNCRCTFVTRAMSIDGVDLTDVYGDYSEWEDAHEGGF